jgi:hypothetical protein
MTSSSKNKSSKPNTTLTREIEVLTKEIHQRVLGDLTTNRAANDRP